MKIKVAATQMRCDWEIENNFNEMRKSYSKKFNDKDLYFMKRD